MVGLRVLAVKRYFNYRPAFWTRHDPQVLTAQSCGAFRKTKKSGKFSDKRRFDQHSGLQVHAVGPAIWCYGYMEGDTEADSDARAQIREVSSA